jgi:hypothetical protein
MHAYVALYIIYFLSFFSHDTGSANFFISLLPVRGRGAATQSLLPVRRRREREPQQQVWAQ